MLLQRLVPLRLQRHQVVHGRVQILLQRGHQLLGLPPRLNRRLKVLHAPVQLPLQVLVLHLQLTVPVPQLRHPVLHLLQVLLIHHGPRRAGAPARPRLRPLVAAVAAVHAGARGGALEQAVDGGRGRGRAAALGHLEVLDLLVQALLLAVARGQHGGLRADLAAELGVFVAQLLALATQLVEERAAAAADARAHGTVGVHEFRIAREGRAGPGWGEGALAVVLLGDVVDVGGVVHGADGGLGGEFLFEAEDLVAQAAVVFVALLSPGCLLLEEVLPDVGFFLAVKVRTEPFSCFLSKRPHDLGHAALLGLLVQVFIPEPLDLGDVLLNLLPEVDQLLLPFLRLLVVRRALLIVRLGAPSGPGAVLLVLELLLKLLDAAAQNLIVPL